MFNRLITPLKTNSFFLFGARGTGKSTFLKRFFPSERCLWFDLLDRDTEEVFKRDPKSFSNAIAAKETEIDWVIVDEIQKVPELLNNVHRTIETSPIKFALTGSSARTLKRDGANLLAGRAFMNSMFPLTHQEMGNSFDLEQALAYGTLPKVTQLNTSLEKNEFLRAYALTYLKEEVWAEHLIRKLDPFRRFLEIAAQLNGEIINYTNIARDVGAAPKTVQSYFELLVDTLLGFFLESHHHSIRKQQRQSPKFYLFDTGVKRALDRTLTQPLMAQTYAYGKAFEHFVVAELYRHNIYKRTDYAFSYLKTKDQAEIDLIIERPGTTTALVEIKSKERVDDRDTRTLNRFVADFKNAQAFLLSRDLRVQRIGKTLALPWQQGICELGL